VVYTLSHPVAPLNGAEFNAFLMPVIVVLSAVVISIAMLYIIYPFFD
jgi:hypothetical protein